MTDPKRAALHQVKAASLFPARRMLTVPREWPPTLLVAIDTEEEFDWRAPPSSATRAVTNVQNVPLLQAIFDRYGMKPVYLVDHPVATCPEAVAVLRAVAEDGRCEIGGHLHPWVTPPVEEKVDEWHAFACNLPAELERAKLTTLTEAIMQAFGIAPRIFKAGGYGVGTRTAGFLGELGYRVDSSVVPFTDFSALGGPDFQDWTGQPFEVDGVVEIPLSAGFAGTLSGHGRTLLPLLRRPLGLALHLPGVAARLALLERLRLSPEGHTLQDMMRLTKAALARGERLFMLSLHSSSLLPGATAYVRTLTERQAFLDRMAHYLEFFHATLGGRSGVVSEVAEQLAAGPAPSRPLSPGKGTPS